MAEILEEKCKDEKLRVVITDMLNACADITEALRTALVTVEGSSNTFGDAQLSVDVVADNIMWEAVKDSKVIREGASEEDPIVRDVDTSGDGVKATIKTKKGEEVLEADLVLSAVGIKTNIENIGLEDVGIVTDKDKIIVNNFYQTNIPGYYAIGDVTAGPALAHVASAEGILCVEKIAGQHVEALDYSNIPGCTYCSPEIASVGLTEKQAKEKGFDIKVGKFPFSASGKASAAGHKDGFVKVIFDAKYGEWLGCHMIGAGVTDMIAEAVLGRKLETTGHEVLKAIHPHPTMSEAVMEAVADAYDEVIHI